MSPEVAVTDKAEGGRRGRGTALSCQPVSLRWFEVDDERPASDVRIELMSHQARDFETMRSTLPNQRQNIGGGAVTEPHGHARGRHSNPPAGLGLQEQSTCMRATARESQNDDDVPADRPAGRQTDRQTRCGSQNMRLVTKYPLLKSQARRLGDAEVTQPYAFVAARRRSRGGRVLLLPAPDFAKRGERCQKPAAVEPNGTKPVPLCERLSELLSICSFRAVVGDGLKAQMSRPMPGFVQVDLMCSFSPTAWRLDQVVIIAPCLPSTTGKPSLLPFHTRSPNSFFLDPRFGVTWVFGFWKYTPLRFTTALVEQHEQQIRSIIRTCLQVLIGACIH